MVSQRLAVKVCGAELALPPSTRAAAPGWFRVCVLGLSAAEVELVGRRSPSLVATGPGLPRLSEAGCDVGAAIPAVRPGVV